MAYPQIIRLIFAALLIAGFGPVLLATQVHASVSVVQQTTQESGIPTFVTTASKAFVMPVTSGDVVVVGILIQNSLETVSSVTDSLGSSYNKAVELVDSTLTLFTSAIYYATISSGGCPCSDTVTVSIGPAANVLDVYLFEVSGVTPPSVSTGTGTSGPPPSSSIATSSTSFTPPAFLIAVVGLGLCGMEAINPGSGFSYVTAPNPSNTCSAVEIADPLSSPTTFPGTITISGSTGSDFWVEVGAAFSAPVAPIPEYPLGLPLIAVLTVLAYGVLRRRTRPNSSVETRSLLR